MRYIVWVFGLGASNHFKSFLLLSRLVISHDCPLNIQGMFFVSNSVPIDMSVFFR
jgi:hypothetical protein